MSITNTRPFTPPLRTENLPANEETRLEIKQLAKRWKTFAEMRMHSATTEPERAIYEASEKVNRVSFQRAGRVSNFKSTFSIEICYGEDLEIKGFAFIKPIQLPIQENPDASSESSENFLHLNYLSTDPQNLDRTTPWKGVGTHLIQSLFQKCVDEGFQGIFVEPLPSAEPFFKRYGFSLSDSTGSKKRAMVWKCPDF